MIWLNLRVHATKSGEQWEPRKFIIGLKGDKAGMKAWAKHIRRAVRDQRQSFEERNSYLRRTLTPPEKGSSEPEPTPEPEPEPEPELEPDGTTAAELEQQEASLLFGGDLNDPSEWVRVVSGGYATVFRADWLGAAVAVKVPHPVQQPELPVFWPEFTAAQQQQMLDLAASQSSADSDEVDRQLSELGLDPIQSYAVVQYVRALRAESSQGQEFLNETRMLMRHRVSTPAHKRQAVDCCPCCLHHRICVAFILWVPFLSQGSPAAISLI